jgi:hypothetical protein
MPRSIMGLAKWLSGVAAVALFAVAVLAVRDAIRVRDVMANGREATALVEGGAGGIRARTQATYWVDLTWQDASGTRHTARGMIGRVLAGQLISGRVPPELLIKYLPDVPGAAPVIVRQAAHDQEHNRNAAIAGLAGGLLCAAGCCLLAWAGWRRGV